MSMKKTMVIDLDRCIGCHSCEIACKMENKVDLGIYLNKMLTIGPIGTYPDIEMYFLPTLCQSCIDAPCIDVCPTGSSYMNEEGVVLVDPDSCVGCNACTPACPYNARSFNHETRLAQKCTLCSHLTEENERPACVKACCAKARFVGDIDDQNSIVCKKLKDAGEENIYTMPDTGNRPTVSYILHERTARWQERANWEFFPKYE